MLLDVLEEGALPAGGQPGSRPASWPPSRTWVSCSGGQVGGGGVPAPPGHPGANPGPQPCLGLWTVGQASTLCALPPPVPTVLEVTVLNTEGQVQELVFPYTRVRTQSSCLPTPSSRTAATVSVQPWSRHPSSSRGEVLNSDQADDLLTGQSLIATHRGALHPSVGVTFQGIQGDPQPHMNLRQFEWVPPVQQQPDPQSLGQVVPFEIKAVLRSQICSRSHRK